MTRRQRNLDRRLRCSTQGLLLARLAAAMLSIPISQLHAQPSPREGPEPQAAPDAQKVDHGSRIYLDDVVFPNSDDEVARLFFRVEAADGNEIVIRDNGVPIDATDINFSAIRDAQGGTVADRSASLIVRPILERCWSRLRSWGWSERDIVTHRGWT